MARRYKHGFNPIDLTPLPQFGAIVRPHFVFDERLEGTGYEETWSDGETVGGSSSLDEDATPHASAPASWGSQSLQASTAAGETAYVGNTGLPDHNKFYFRAEIIYDTQGISNGEIVYPVFFLHNATDNMLLLAIFNSSGTLVFIVIDSRDGSFSQRENTGAISVDTLYRFEYKWDLSDNTVEWRINGSTIGSGSITGGGTSLNINDFFVGIVSNTSTGSDVVQLDRVAVSRHGWIGAA